MTWIKKNLFWVVGGVIALGLVGAAFFYLYTNMQSEKEIDEQLRQKLAKGQELINAGSAGNEGIQEVKKGQQRVEAVLSDVRKFFTPIPYPPIRDSHEFRLLLDRTIEQLERDAKDTAVTLPPKYTFSFKPQSEAVQFDSANLRPLAMQLAEINAICQIIFKAKVHSIENVRRVPIAREDVGQNDYIDKKAVTNALEIHMPYEFTFRSFSAEFGSVVEGLARSPHCFLIKSLNAETTTPVSSTETPSTAPSMLPGPFFNPYNRYGVPGQGGPESGGGAMDARMRQRYGMRYTPPPETPPPQLAAPPVKTGPVILLEEKPLRVTMTIEAVRLRDTEAKQPGAKPEKPRTPKPVSSPPEPAAN
ncbi:MAG TPA: Amuc_1100 family pilus-like protein [Patescibacteria group bacterium]|nr:Amuc_1100 family pilus-like protein [Patescibacteria group bacterium]